MKIKTMRRSYDEVMTLPRPAHKKPWKPTLLMSTVMRLASAPDLWATHLPIPAIRKASPESPASSS